MSEVFVSPFRAGLACRCPRCGEGRLYGGFLAVATGCDVCDLDYSKVDSGDGPAVFVIFIIGAVAAALALWVEFNFEPPVWVHVIYLLPLVLGGSLVLLRPMKALLIALQYKNAATQDVDLQP
ncbi:MAG: DUF983 domain-containing protein [Minwuia sp.]|uniref:DUF983 domain-containing protein n=1 Tax=Minwuia sp. TaxID=2493630 RepID=UPI003A85A8CD